MAIEKINIDVFLQLATQYPVLDVRSPGEYKHAHIPGAVSLPLFTDEERKVVGTAYKQESRQAAIKIGLNYFGPTMRKMVEDVELLLASRKDNTKTNNANKCTPIVLTHCWRGGMRSAAVAWLLDLYGFKVYTLAGGYKRFRQYVLETFEQPYNFNILGGYTGSGKTEILKTLQQQNQTVIDLEELAHHKGSAFGNLGMAEQPTQEMFENKLALYLQQTNINTTIWLEDESQRIGNINIPPALWYNMRQAVVYFVNIPFDERLQYITQWYGKQDKEKMISAIIRIRKRLGGLETKTAVNYLLEDNVTESFRVLLKYYDKWYTKGLQNRETVNKQIHIIECNKVTASANTQALLTYKTVVVQ